MSRRHQSRSRRDHSVVGAYGSPRATSSITFEFDPDYQPTTNDVDASYQLAATAADMGIVTPMVGSSGSGSGTPMTVAGYSTNCGPIAPKLTGTPTPPEFCISSSDWAAYTEATYAEDGTYTGSVFNQDAYEASQDWQDSAPPSDYLVTDTITDTVAAFADGVPVGDIAMTAAGGLACNNVEDDTDCIDLDYDDIDRCLDDGTVVVFDTTTANTTTLTCKAKCLKCTAPPTPGSGCVDAPGCLSVRTGTLYDSEEAFCASAFGTICQIMCPPSSGTCV